MLIFNKQVDLVAHLSPLWSQNTSIGFVPTMGALHKGHLSLIEKAAENNDLTVVSVFVNPTQFNNQDDLKKYPRTLEKDIEIISSLNKNCIVFAPSIEDMYGKKTISSSFSFDGLEHQMEGSKRPGHFDGVGTIVKRLFEIIQPTAAYFGEKDFQQLQIVRKLTEKLNFNIKIIGCPVFREKNGLAMSSRNERLTPDERQKSAFIFQTLQKAKLKFGTKSANQVKKWVEHQFDNQNEFKLEYFEIADEKELLSCKRKVSKKKYRAFIAVFINNIRLIDTISLN